MKFLNMNMADALLLVIGFFMVAIAVTLPLVSLTMDWSTPLAAASIGVAAVFAGIAVKLIHRVVTHPLPIFEHAPSTDYRPKRRV